MATRAFYPTVLSAMGLHGPRARALAVELMSSPESGREIAFEVAEDPSVRGAAGLAGGFFDFIPETLKAIPDLSAALGLKSAKEFAGVKASLQQQQLQTQRVQAEGEAKASTLREVAPWVAIGVGGLALAGAMAYAISRAASARATAQAKRRAA